MSIRDRMISATPPLGLDDATRAVDAILAACPEIAALDHAREVWIWRDDTVTFSRPFRSDYADPGWVIPKPDAS